MSSAVAGAPTRRTDRGQATIELALSLPLLVLFVLCFVQVAVVVRDQLAVQTAARNGARAASASRGPTTAALRAATTTVDLRPLAVTTSESAGSVTVRVRYVQHTSVPIIGLLLPDITLTASVAMPVEPP